MAQVRRMKATHDYVGKDESELTFKQGDTIMVPAPELETSKDMIKGVFNNKIGLFPRIYVDDTSVKHKAGQATKVKALGNYEAQNDEELSFPKDANMFVAAKHNDKFWKGVYNGKAGLIPMHMVIDANAEKKLDPAKAGSKCVAIRTLVNENPGQLSFKIGQSIFVQDADPAKAEWKGVCNSIVGTFPKEYVLDTATSSAEEIAAATAKNAGTPEEAAAAEKYQEVMNKRAEILAAASVQKE
eukprot:m.23072 g.23072  ORF g.23072 m.23072 type:complete len:242 (+) comp4051_c0_seq1:2070-2795(+)